MTAEGPLVLDATVLSNFACSDSVPWLAECSDEPVVPVAVRDELRLGVEEGYEFLRQAVDLCESSAVTIVRTPVSTGDGDRSYAPSLDQGEAAALTHAKRANGLLATDEGVARRVAREQDIELTGSIGLLVRGVVTESLAIETAEQWLQTWTAERQYYAPVESVREALPDERDGENR